MITSTDESCPDEDCDSRLRTCWVKGRLLRKECPECGAVSEPYTPPKKPIRTVRTTSHFEGGCWTYESFDQYGHTMCLSRGFATEAECIKAAKYDIDKCSKIPAYGKCSAVVWPPVVKVQGKRIR